MIREIAKWRYQGEEFSDWSDRSCWKTGSGVSFDLYHCRGKYLLSIYPSEVNVSQSGLTSESYDPMESMRFSLLDKRFNKSTADKLCKVLSVTIPSVVPFLSGDPSSIKRTLESVRV